MDWIETITLFVFLMLFAFAAIYVMRVPEPENKNVTSSVVDGHHVYSVNVSDSTTVKGGA